MKILSCFCQRLRLLGSLALLITAMLARSELPVIQSIRVENTNVVVTTRVPPGHVRVTLESRNHVGPGAWVPVAVQRLDGQGGTVTFRLRRSAEFAVLRVRADATEPLPASFYTGTNSFIPQPTSGAGEGPAALDSGTTPGGSPTTSRDVVESDIWRLDGDTLYFFNQNRGLQVIDVTNPDAATLRGTLNLPAAGEQMYLLGSNYVALLTRNGCGGYGAYSAGYGDSQVLIVAVNNGVPSIVTNLAVGGTIAESRLVGTALYVAAQTVRPVPGGGGATWEWGTQVVSFDLAVPDAAVVRSTLWYAGYNNAVHATDTYLFTVTQDPANWQRSTINAIDITAPDGTMHAYDTVSPAGRVADKFKLDWSEGIFSVISEVSVAPRVTKLETFRLPDPRSLPPISRVKLGEVELGHGESLFATRFDYPRAYVVTFLQIDPLWVVDLSDPAHPAVSGELEVPGWSTYIHPRGNQLLAVGVEANRTTVSLFDVSDPGHPSLLSRAQLGNQYSSSEANHDEKAFAVLEDAGLILLPVQGATTNGYESWVQLIDLRSNSLAIRGRIEHEFAPRRATLHRNRVVSLSGVELLSVDATDRDHPQLTGQLDLAWPINRVLLAGDYLIEITTGDAWSAQAHAVVRVAPALNPDTVLTTLTLTNGTIAGATVRSNRLYLVLANGSDGSVILSDGTNSKPSNSIWLAVVDLSNLPALSLLGQTAVATTPLGWNSELEPLWPGPELLVWVGGGNNYWWWGPSDVVSLGGPALFGGSFWPYPQSGGGGRLLAFDVSRSASPSFLSEVDLATNGWWSFSRPFAADGLVYLSHQAFVEFVTSNSSTGTATETSSPLGTIVRWPTGFQRSFLDVVDYADARHPAVRPPVSIPGTLQGISHNGALLYTIGFHSASTNSYEGAEALDASAYDGVAAYLVDSLSLSNVWPHPALVSGTNVFLGRAQIYYSTTNTLPPALETWALSSAGKFTKLGGLTLPSAASDLVSFPGLLAAQVDWSRVIVFDRSNPAALRQVGDGPTAGCLYFNLRHADAAPGHALWLPLDAYGVARIDLSP